MDQTAPQRHFTSAIKPAGQDPEAQPAPGIDCSTAPVAPGSQYILDNLAQIPQHNRTSSRLIAALMPPDLKVRIAERDHRPASDNRSPAERWLGDPPHDRSALAQLVFRRT